MDYYAMGVITVGQQEMEKMTWPCGPSELPVTTEPQVTVTDTVLGVGCRTKKRKVPCVPKACGLGRHQATR